MTYTFEGNEYKVFYQSADDSSNINMIKAYRVDKFNFIEVITITDYKRIGEVDVRKAELHIRDLMDLAGMVREEMVV